MVTIPDIRTVAIRNRHHSRPARNYNSGVAVCNSLVKSTVGAGSAMRSAGLALRPIYPIVRYCRRQIT